MFSGGSKGNIGGKGLISKAVKKSIFDQTQDYGRLSQEFQDYQPSESLYIHPAGFNKYMFVLIN